MVSRLLTWAFPLSIKDRWLVLWQAKIPKGFPTNPWGHPTHISKWVKGALPILGEILYPSIKILMEIHYKTPYLKENATPRNPCTIFEAKRWEECKSPQVIRHHHGLSWGHQTIFLFWHIPDLYKLTTQPTIFSVFQTLWWMIVSITSFSLHPH